MPRSLNHDGGATASSVGGLREGPAPGPRPPRRPHPRARTTGEPRSAEARPRASRGRRVAACCRRDRGRPAVGSGAVYRDGSRRLGLGSARPSVPARGARTTGFEPRGLPERKELPLSGLPESPGEPAGRRPGASSIRWPARTSPRSTSNVVPQPDATTAFAGGSAPPGPAVDPVVTNPWFGCRSPPATRPLRASAEVVDPGVRPGPARFQPCEPAGQHLAPPEGVRATSPASGPPAVIGARPPGRRRKIDRERRRTTVLGVDRLRGGEAEEGQATARWGPATPGLPRTSPAAGHSGRRHERTFCTGCRRPSATYPAPGANRACHPGRPFVLGARSTPSLPGPRKRRPVETRKTGLTRSRDAGPDSRRASNRPVPTAHGGGPRRPSPSSAEEVEGRQVRRSPRTTSTPHPPPPPPPAARYQASASAGANNALVPSVGTTDDATFARASSQERLNRGCAVAPSPWRPPPRRPPRPASVTAGPQAAVPPAPRRLKPRTRSPRVSRP